MGASVSTNQNVHNMEERQDPATENLIENPVDGQPRPPGATPVARSWNRAIIDFIMECLCSDWCMGGFGDEMDDNLIPLTPLLSGAEIELEDPIHNTNPLGETKTSLNKTLTNGEEVTTKENEQRPSDSDPNAGTGVDGSEVAGTEADGSVVTETRTDDSALCTVQL